MLSHPFVASGPMPTHTRPPMVNACNVPHDSVIQYDAEEEAEAPGPRLELNHTGYMTKLGAVRKNWKVSLSTHATL